VKRMTYWGDRCLSQAAKEVLIKSVAQSLLTYVMSVFEIPVGMCDALQKHTRSFWWGSEGGKCKVQWIPWEVLIKPKSFSCSSPACGSYLFVEMPEYCGCCGKFV
jgi:hypothetical protein